MMIFLFDLTCIYIHLAILKDAMDLPPTDHWEIKDVLSHLSDDMFTYRGYQSEGLLTTSGLPGRCLR